MECPQCGCKTKVLDSRPYAGTVYRERKCTECNFRFWTEEIELEKDDMQVIRELRSYMQMKYRDSKRRKSENEDGH